MSELDETTVYYANYPHSYPKTSWGNFFLTTNILNLNVNVFKVVRLFDNFYLFSILFNVLNDRNLLKFSFISFILCIWSCYNYKKFQFALKYKFNLIWSHDHNLNWIQDTRCNGEASNYGETNNRATISSV